MLPFKVASRSCSVCRCRWRRLQWRHLSRHPHHPSSSYLSIQCRLLALRIFAHTRAATTGNRLQSANYFKLVTPLSNFRNGKNISCIPCTCSSTYTLWVQQTAAILCVHCSFAKCWPIFRILLLLNLARNLQQNPCHIAHCILPILLRYNAKFKYVKLSLYH